MELLKHSVIAEQLKMQLSSLGFALENVLIPCSEKQQAIIKMEIVLGMGLHLRSS